MSAWLGGGEREKHWLLGPAELERTGGAWVVMTERMRCSVIRTMAGDVIVGMQANSDCWFEWVPNPKCRE